MENTEPCSHATQNHIISGKNDSVGTWISVSMYRRFGYRLVLKQVYLGWTKNIHDRFLIVDEDVCLFEDGPTDRVLR